MLVPDRSIADVFCVSDSELIMKFYTRYYCFVSNLFGSFHETQIAVYFSNVLDYSTW